MHHPPYQDNFLLYSEMEADLHPHQTDLIRYVTHSNNPEKNSPKMLWSGGKILNF